MRFCSNNTSFSAPYIAILFSVLLLQSGTAAAVSVGMVDTFSDGTLQGWQLGSIDETPQHMTNIVDGGPAGVGDNYLQTVADALEPAAGNRLTILNRLQWAGDYTTAGVTSIAMDVSNFGPDPLNLRLGISGGTVIDPVNGTVDGGLFVTTASVSLAAGSGWTHVVFSFVASDFTAVSGRSGQTGNNIDATLADVWELRLLNSATPSWTGLKTTTTLGIDNISAVPLPPALLLYGSGLIILGAWRRRRGAPNPALLGA